MKAKLPTVIRPVPSVTVEIERVTASEGSHAKAEIPIDVTLFGITIEGKFLVESENARSGIVTRPSFNVSEVKASRSAKA